MATDQEHYHAIRFYELLIQWRDAGTRRIELDWLRERLDLGNKYPNIRDLKRWVLNPAVEQINAHSDLWVKWEQHKRGRTIHALTFTFGSKVEPEPKKAPKPKLTREYIRKHAKVGESWPEATERLRRELNLA